MTIRSVLQTLFIAATLFYTFQSCMEAKAETAALSISNEREALAKTYYQIPREGLFEDKVVMKEMRVRYRKYMIEMNKKVKATGAKFVVMYLTAGVGQNESPLHAMGRTFLETTCKELKIDFVDVSCGLIGKDATEITYYPKDGHFSKAGAKLIEKELESIIPNYINYHSTTTYTERPKLFGDQAPLQDAILDGGKELPYRLKTNTQGLRMNYDLAFPKTKQRMLFMGDSGFFFPFMDNKNIASIMLQEKFPNIEFVNSCNWGYAIDDHITLFEQRAKFTEPDVVFMQTSGSDIIDMYFSNRNLLSRNPEAWLPSVAEKAFYERTFKSQQK
jgi:hypothetical protein